MILLKQILEQYGVEGHYYDLGKDFFTFHRTIDGADGQIRQQFEQTINAKLTGKRVQAQASRGYKQFQKVYEFDISRVTLEDYYDNYVVVAYDNTTPKAKEYFLKSGFKVQIIGPATGQPSPQKGGKPQKKQNHTTPSPMPMSPHNNPTRAQNQPMALAPAGNTPSEQPLKEDGEKNKQYDAYSVDDISKDIETWLPKLLLKPDTAVRDFVKGLGWKSKNKAAFELELPINVIKPGVTKEIIQQSLSSIKDALYTLKKMELNDNKDEWTLRLVKTIKIK